MGIVFSGPSRAQLTTTVPINITITPAAPAPTAPAGNGTAPAGNGNGTTSSTPTTYPFAPTSVDPGAAGGQTAPSPGSKGNPAMGPDDDYISGARQLAVGGVTLVLGLGLAIVAQQLA
ncbi:hypothetical protein FRC12_010783 [Ceratobasidium sp. 428]|nr:hypothetical protein FRC12_010783 [Ceratobasidium sp. 428]